MEGRVALVTGAGRGIGRGIALSLAREGWSVAVNYRSSEQDATKTVQECRQEAERMVEAGSILLPGRFEAFRADISRTEDRGALVASVLAWGGRIDALVNNAGVAPASRTDMLEAGEDSFRSLLSINLEGPYFLTRLVAKVMMESRHAEDTQDNPEAGGGREVRAPGMARSTENADLSRGRIVFVTSVSAEMASSTRGDYCVSKAGLAMAARLWSARLAPEGIPVFEIRPGIMATDMTAGVKDKYDALIGAGLVPAGRWGTPSDVGKAVASILSGNWDFATGSVMHLDGGLHLARL